MSDDLRIERTYEDGVYTVTATVENPSVLPTDIFLYENEEGALGGFYTVCTLDNLTRPKFSDLQPGANFGVKYVRHDEATKTFDTLASAQEFETAVLSRVNQLYLQLVNSVDYVKVYTITGV